MGPKLLEVKFKKHSFFSLLAFSCQVFVTCPPDIQKEIISAIPEVLSSSSVANYNYDF
jgi:hypothetical protein